MSGTSRPSTVAGVARLEFQMESSDTSNPPLSIPDYFCFDNLFFSVESVSKLKKYPVKLYPNPAQTYIKSDLVNAESYEITDIQGKVFIKSDLNTENVISVQNLPPGLYFIKLFSEHKMYTSKFIKN